MKRLFFFTSILASLVACKATRAGYETAQYTTEKKVENFEIRTYPELHVAATSNAPKPEQTEADKTKRNDDGQFMRLFGYITGKNEGEQKIAMTTPVFMDKKDDATRMSFVLPATLTQESAPKPKSEQVQITKLPARKMAVLRYSGKQGKELEDVHLAKLRIWMAEQKLVAAGEPVVAYYDPPFVPSALRRNEVMIPVK